MLRNWHARGSPATRVLDVREPGESETVLSWVHVVVVVGSAAEDLPAPARYYLDEGVVLISLGGSPLWTPTADPWKRRSSPPTPPMSSVSQKPR
ncbi:hypothetical protein [Nocardia australiensis]|uniref:hypothetical protein n=1 Tax=Nocardia australiensis TaxID=2887191 RepID=UPI001D151FC9|nr:hypothetical protein [Nocardia australiensis]